MRIFKILQIQSNKLGILHLFKTSLLQGQGRRNRLGLSSNQCKQPKWMSERQLGQLQGTLLKQMRSGQAEGLFFIQRKLEISYCRECLVQDNELIDRSDLPFQSCYLNIYYKMSKKPFIIKSRVLEPMIPSTSELYDDIQQSRIQIVQAANGYLTINMLYESFKLMWSFWHYKETCANFAYLSLGFMALNIIWAITSYMGFRSIRSKNSRNITLFGYSLIANFILRLAIYIACGVVMSGYANKYFEIKTEQINNLICKAIYPQALFILQGVIEAIICLFVMFLVKGIIQYVVKWERSQLEKFSANKFNDLSHY